MPRVRAVRKETYDNLQFDAGVLFINLDISSAKTAQELFELVKAAPEDNRLGVTRGGISFTSEAEWREIEFDDNPGPFMGSSEKGIATVTLETTLIEATPENTKLAMGTADIIEVDGVTVVQERDYIDILKDYIPKLLLVARKGKDKFNVIEMDNVISTGGYNEQTNSEGETEISITLQATREDMDTVGDLPYRKLFFPVATETAPI